MLHCSRNYYPWLASSTAGLEVMGKALEAAGHGGRSREGETEVPHGVQEAEKGEGRDEKSVTSNRAQLLTASYP